MDIKIRSMNQVIPLLLFLMVGIDLEAQKLRVPIDYSNPESGTFELQYEFGAEFRPELPTVIVIADAQQFYVRPGRVPAIQEELFGSEVNVLGILPRSGNAELLEQVRLNTDEEVNWNRAYTAFRSEQFINDIERVIREVLSGQQDIYLYGQSGGAYLITEYLSTFPETKVQKVFLGAGVNPVIEARLGILHDNFQRDFLAEHEAERMKLDRALRESFFDRSLVASLFQRQHFFVELSELNESRRALINHLYIKDTAYVSNLKREYQIDAINNLLKSEAGVPIRVRIAEFITPLLSAWEIGGDALYPDLENSYHIAVPVLESVQQPIASSFDAQRFRAYRGEVLFLAGRYDHVADYRSAIYLSALLEHSRLFIADDDHTFKSMKAADDYSRFIQDFFQFSNGQEWINRYSSYRWREE